MAGIYIHIPFCKQACSYCNFHFSTQLNHKSDLVDAILKEMELRKGYFGSQEIETIYFGGGTPSLLNEKELDSIFNALNKNFRIKENVEITLEANPDDLDDQKLKILKNSPINRLSIGVQSFFDKDLKFMNRSHTAEEALSSIKLSQDYGFEALNIDLIFGAQTTTNQMWQMNLRQFFDLNIPHLSAYSLTIEEKTVLANRIYSGLLSKLDEDKNYQQYRLLLDAIQAKGYEQYELSNYCKEGKYARHNTAYWQGKSYLGLGPSAHSFHKNSRQWNVSNNSLYRKAINDNTPYFEHEKLTEKDQYHEFLLTSLRTKWGISFIDIQRFSKMIQQHFYTAVSQLSFSGVLLDDKGIKISSDYLFQSDEVVRSLMLT